MKAKKVFILHYGQQAKNIGVSFEMLCWDSSLEYHLIADNLSVVHIKEKDDLSRIDKIHVVPIYDQTVEINDVKNIVNDNIVSSGEIRSFIAFFEFSVLDAGILSNDFGLHDIDYEKFTNKKVMKTVLKDKGVKLPEGLMFNRHHYQESPEDYIGYISDTIGYPLFIKPSNMGGAIGTSRIETPVDLSLWIQHHRNSRYDYLIEEYIEGTFYHCESFIHGGKVVFSQVCEYADPLFYVKEGKAMASITLQDDSADAVAITALSEKVHRGLSPLADGLTHAEFFKRSNGDIVFIETAFRPPGSLSTALYHHRAGLQAKELHGLLHIHPDMHFSYEKKAYAARLAFPLPLSEGQLIETNTPVIDSDLRFEYKPGDYVGKNQGQLSYFAYMIMWNDDYNTLRADFENMRHYVPYIMSE